ncbi:MAG: hypothetical protein IGS54_18490 [Elainella sp. C42_A2020_010]|nr:hypothetical protein [Elainella sp. C42_A2020_010]
MSDTDQSVQVTVLIPKDVYRQVTETAAGEHRQIEDFLGVLIAEGLASHVTVRQIMETVSAQYRDRLKLTGHLGQPPNEVLQHLQDLREQIADELYPD